MNTMADELARLSPTHPIPTLGSPDSLWSRDRSTHHSSRSWWRATVAGAAADQLESPLRNSGDKACARSSNDWCCLGCSVCRNKDRSLSDRFSHARGL